MGTTPKKVDKLIKENEALIKKVWGDVFFYKVAQGEISSDEMKLIHETLRAAALDK